PDAEQFRNMTGFTELIWLSLIILVLSASGLWPTIMRGLRELRGERIEEEPRTTGGISGGGVDMCFRLLGISPSSSWDEIEKAYKRKAKIHHPDRGGDEDTMRALNESYNRLK